MGSKKYIKREIPQGSRIKGHEEKIEDTNNENPKFSFHLTVKKYTIDNCQKDEKCNFIKSLFDLSKLTWIQIWNRPYNNGGIEKIPRYELRFSIPYYISDDVDILATKMNIKGRILGYREKAIFHILWIDKDHKAYIRIRNILNEKPKTST